MLNGKALHGLRMVVCALVEEFMNDGINLHDVLEKASQHPTGKLWVDDRIKPTLIAHLVIIAMKENYTMLSVYCEQNMLPYFNAAGHWAYARYMTYHMIEVTAGLSKEALEMYMGINSYGMKKQIVELSLCETND